jgi:DNA-binding NarL/FixJ family response regulator
MVARERELLEEPHSVYRVLIVDDHAGFRRCARELLTTEGFAVVGEQGTARRLCARPPHRRRTSC